MNNYYTINLPKVQLGSEKLLSQTLEYLIGYIYSHREQSLYDDPEVRVGIVEKLLIRLLETQDFPSSIALSLNPVIRDLKDLIDNPKTYEGYDNPSFKRECLIKELRLLNNIVEPKKENACTLL